MSRTRWRRCWLLRRGGRERRRGRGEVVGEGSWVDEFGAFEHRITRKARGWELEWIQRRVEEKTRSSICMGGREGRWNGRIRRGGGKLFVFPSTSPSVFLPACLLPFISTTTQLTETIELTTSSSTSLQVFLLLPLLRPDPSCEECFP